MNRTDFIKGFSYSLAGSLIICLFLVFFFAFITWLSNGLWGLPEYASMTIVKCCFGLAAVSLVGLIFTYYIENIFFMRKQIDIYTRDLDDLQKKTEQLFWPVNTLAGHFLAFVLLQLSCIALSWYLGKWLMGFADISQSFAVVASYVVLIALSMAVLVYLLSIRTKKLAEDIKDIVKNSDPILTSVCKNLQQEIFTRNERIDKLKKELTLVKENSIIKQILPNNKYIGCFRNRNGNTIYYFGEYLLFYYDCLSDTIKIIVAKDDQGTLKMGEKWDKAALIEEINKARLRDMIFCISKLHGITKFQAAQMVQEEITKLPLLVVNDKARECLNLLLEGKNPFTAKYNND